MDYLIQSSYLSQSIALARTLRLHSPKATVIGCVMPGEPCPAKTAPYTRIEPYGEHDPNVHKAICIPTGASSTRMWLERVGELTLGQVTMTAASLKVWDKVEMTARCHDLGIPTPTTYRSLDQVNSYPVFYKGATEGGKCRGILHKREDLFEANAPQSPLIFQEVIHGTGTHGVAFLARAGQLLASSCHWERYSLPRVGGSAVLIEDWHDQRVVDYTKCLLRDLNYSGWGLAEFKFCPSRRDFVFMEINAKFWASLYFTLANEPAFLRLLFGLESKLKRCRRMIFADRMLMAGPITALLSSVHALPAKLVWDEPLLAVLRQGLGGFPRDTKAVIAKLLQRSSGTASRSQAAKTA